MSIAIMSKVFYTDIPNLSYKESNKELTVSATTAKFVLLAIADSSDDFGENSYNGYERLGQKTSLQRRSVMRAIKALTDNGYLSCLGKTSYGTKSFKIALDKLGEPPTARTKVGRPKEIGDSEAIIGDSTSSDSSLSIQNHPIKKEMQVNTFSPAGKNGDNMRTKEELMKGTEEAYLRSLNNSTSDYAHIPEHARPWIQKVCELWNLKPPGRKAKDLGYWITGASDLQDACSEFGIDLLTDIHAEWRDGFQNGYAPWTINAPNSLVKTARGKAGMKRQGISGTIKQGKPKYHSLLDV